MRSFAIYLAAGLVAALLLAPVAGMAKKGGQTDTAQGNSGEKNCVSKRAAKGGHGDPSKPICGTGHHRH